MTYGGANGFAAVGPGFTGPRLSGEGLTFFSNHNNIFGEKKNEAFQGVFVSAKKRFIYKQVLQALLTVGCVIAKSRLPSNETHPLGGSLPGVQVHPTYREIPLVRQEFDNY